jgi:hypothetical protein
VIFRDEIVYVDPTNAADALNVSKPRQDGRVYGAIGVTHGVDLDNGQNILNGGRSQSICVRPGDEKALLAAIGDRLLGAEGGKQTVVATVAELQALREELTRQYDSSDAVHRAIGDLIDRLVKSIASLPGTAAGVR